MGSSGSPVLASMVSSGSGSGAGSDRKEMDLKFVKSKYSSGGSGTSGRGRRRRDFRQLQRGKIDIRHRTTLAEKIDKDQIDVMREIFLAKMKMDPNRPRVVGSANDLNTFSRGELRQLLFDQGIAMDEDDFEVVFMKMDTDQSGRVTWGEMVSHLLLELMESSLRERAPEGEKLGFLDSITDPPERMRSGHRHNIIRITFCQEVFPDRSHSLLYGKFVTASKDGTLQYWNMDMTKERSVVSESALLKVRSTWVTDVVCIPDINMVCTSSTERELRFYDTTANKWELRVLISNLVQPVVCMHYQMAAKATDESCLIMGDMNGDIKVLLFTSERRGPFKQKVGREVTHVLYPQLLQGGLPGLSVVEFAGVHADWVRQVSYYESCQSFVSCAVCPTTSMFMSDPRGTKSKYRYNVDGGLNCFTFTEDTHMIATGGPDCVVRVWNPFVSAKPNVVLIGHHAGIVAIVIQDAGQVIYSLDMTRCIRVWNVSAQVCSQTYTPMVGGPCGPLATYYHPLSRSWMIADKDISVVRLKPLLNPDRTDGYTAISPIAIVVYNSLFKYVITIGFKAIIQVWDIWRGVRVRAVFPAHSRMVLGRMEPIEVTAACFDPPQQLLLSGAADGSLKIWNFNTGACMRNMTIGKNMEVSSVAWVPSRILAVGWNMRVTEFSDTGAALTGKSWDLRHTGHILCADARPPEALATASDCGELVFWRLETGQNYARYSVAEPVHKSGMAHYVEAELKPPRYWVKINMPKCTGAELRPPRVHDLRFLRARPVTRGMGTLLVSLSTGYIQVWSHHPVGGYLTQFLAVHKVSDYVMCMEVDPDNNYLLTGHAAGYIKVWLLANYCYPGGAPVNVFLPGLRKTFPFLYRDRFPGRAKRAVRHQPLPMLLSSYRGHLEPVRQLRYIPENKLVVSSSVDKTVRLWTLSGEYIGTLGGLHAWPGLTPGAEWDPGDRPPTIPADLKRVSSSTTMKVLRRGVVEWTTPTLSERRDAHQGLRPLTLDELLRCTYGQRPYKPILGHYYRLPSRAIGRTPTIALDSTMPMIPVYSHIALSEEVPIPRPPTPKSVAAIRNLKLNVKHHSENVPQDSVGARKSSSMIRHTGSW